jgi:hypothetical protein
MSPTTTPETDPVSLLVNLSSDDVRAEIGKVEDRRRALTVLLRAACARERAARRRQATTSSPPEQEVTSE